jgi:uncharacterized protein YbjT (DUF2867 family)
VGRGLVINRHELCRLCAPVTELCARAAGFDDRHADPERCGLLCDRLDETLNAPFRRVVHRVPWERDLPAVGRNLDDPSPALLVTPMEVEAQVVVGDVTRPDTLPGAVDGVDAVVFTLGSDGAGKVGAESVDYGGSRTARIALKARRWQRG